MTHAQGRDGFSTHARISQDQKDGDVARTPPMLRRVDQRIHGVRPRDLWGRLTVEEVAL